MLTNKETKDKFFGEGIFDIRMFSSSGIGSYIRNLIKFGILVQISELLVNKEIDILIKKEKAIIINSKSYSIAEQFILPIKIPSSKLFFSPHYNIPLLPTRAKKRLVTIHDVFHLAFFHSLSFRQKIYAKLMINAAVRLSDQIITVSEFSKSEISKYTGVSPDKINVIYNGVDFSQFKKIDNSDIKNQIIHKYQLPNNFLLYVGNVKPHKNLIGLIEAYNFSKKIKSSFHLVIVGKKEGFITSDNEIDQLIKRYQLEDKILFTGYVEEVDLTPIYNLASWFIFPSLYEGFGLPPLEAMACGTPVVASDIPVFHEIYDNAFVPVNTTIPKLFASTLEKALFNNDLKESLILKGLIQCKKYTWEKSAQKHIELIQKMIS